MVVVHCSVCQNAHHILFPWPEADDSVNGEATKSPETTMAARAVLMCRPNSHPFQERSLPLDQSVKIGRSVARVRPSTSNAIFDCKVLSRNHALLWYENGKFYLQDTKSSNGTFVNNQRLSKGSEESPPREVCSGDIVQFGVDVMENSRKVTHGCIVATLKLYLPDGKEAKASPSTSVASNSVPMQDLYQLNQYLQEALQREQMLERKLASVQTLVKNTKEAAESGWKALINEDRLLTRIEILESQLQTYSKNFSEDKLREEVQLLQEDKEKYQSTTKETLLKMLQEKLEVVKKLQEVEQSLSNTEEECCSLKTMCDSNQQELQELGTKYTDEQRKVEEYVTKLRETDSKHKEDVDKLEQEKKELEYRLAEKGTDGDETKLVIEVPDEKEDGDANTTFEEKDVSSTNDSEATEKIKDVDGDHVHVNGLGNGDCHEELLQLRSQLEASEQKRAAAEREASAAKTDLEAATSGMKKARDDANQLLKQLDAAAVKDKEKDVLVADLEEQLEQVKTATSAAERELLLLRTRVDEDKCRSKAAAIEAEALRRQLAVVEKQREEEGRKSAVADDEIQGELPAFVARVQELESELASAKSEVWRLQDLTKMLRQTQNDVLHVNEELAIGCESKLAVELQRLCRRLAETEGNLVTLKEKYVSCSDEKQRLQSSLDSLNRNLDDMVWKSRRALLLVIVPLGLVLFATLIALHPAT